jgi:hypothetical protein
MLMLELSQQNITVLFGELVTENCGIATSAKIRLPFFSIWYNYSPKKHFRPLCLKELELLPVIVDFFERSKNAYIFEKRILFQKRMPVGADILVRLEPVHHPTN